MIGLKLKTILLVAGYAGATAAVAGAWLHYNGILKDRETLRANVATLEASVLLQKDAIDESARAVRQWQQKYMEAQERLSRYVEIQEDSRREFNRLRRLFAENDLEELASENPELLERAANLGATRINRLLECASSGNIDCAPEPAPPSGGDDSPEAAEAPAD